MRLAEAQIAAAVAPKSSIPRIDRRTATLATSTRIGAM